MIDKKDFTFPEELYFEDGQPYRGKLHPYGIYSVNRAFIRSWHKTRGTRDTYGARYFPGLMPIYNRHKIKNEDAFRMSRTYAPIEYVLLKAFMFLFESCSDVIVGGVLRTIRQYLLKYDIHLIDRQLKYRPDAYTTKFDLFGFDRLYPIKKGIVKTRDNTDSEQISGDFSSLLKDQDEGY